MDYETLFRYLFLIFFMTDQELLDTNIITLLGMEQAGDEQKASIISALATLVQKQVTLRILELLSKEEIAELEKIIAEHGDNAPEVLEFIRARIPQLDIIAEEELISVKRQIMEKMQEVRGEEQQQEE
jgi:hypothetical protein